MRFSIVAQTIPALAATSTNGISDRMKRLRRDCEAGHKQATICAAME